MSKEVPRLWSDFDGTAVELVRKTNPRNWTKFPLAAMAGYLEFLAGVQSSGIEIAGVVTRRPDIFVRRMATARSIKKLGFSEFFTDPAQIIHAGSEIAKGRFIAEQSRKTTVGMLEDKPHKLAPVILGALTEPLQHPDRSHHSIVIGVVSHKHSMEYMERLKVATKSVLRGAISITETDDEGAAGLSVAGESFRLNVIQLPGYSHTAGQDFGQHIQALSFSHDETK